MHFLVVLKEQVYSHKFVHTIKDIFRLYSSYWLMPYYIYILQFLILDLNVKYC